MRSTREILRDVDEGAELFRQIEALKDQLAEIETRLIQDGLDRPDEHQPLIDKRREGRQFIVRGSDVEVPVVFTADKIIKTSLTDSGKLKHAMELAGDLFSRFYAAKATYINTSKSGPAFRALARDLLGRNAPAFISACLDRDNSGIPKNDIKVEWKRAIDESSLELRDAVEAVV